MVPIHDTDVAETRWSQAEWNHYELWEKVEQRLRRRKWLWISATVALFLVLSAVPVVMLHWPKWVALTAASRLGREINHLKTMANVERAAFRLRFVNDGATGFVIEKAESCASTQWTSVRQAALVSRRRAADFSLIPPSQGLELGIPGLVDSFCYDYLSGSEAIVKGETVVGFAVAPVVDLAARRLDRSSIVLLTGPSAEISFD